MIVIESVAGRSWKAVELFGSSRLCVSHFYLRLLKIFRASEILSSWLMLLTRALRSHTCPLRDRAIIRIG